MCQWLSIQHLQHINYCNTEFFSQNWSNKCRLPETSKARDPLEKSQQSLELEPLVGFLGQSRYVLGPGQVIDHKDVLLLTISTAAPSMYREEWLGCFLLKSTLTSIVLSTFRSRLLRLQISPPLCTPAPPCLGLGPPLLCCLHCLIWWYLYQTLHNSYGSSGVFFPHIKTGVCMWESPVSSCTCGGLRLNGPSLPTKCRGIVVINTELKSTNSFWTWSFCSSRCSRLRWSAQDTLSSEEYMVLSKHIIIMGVSATVSAYDRWQWLS